MSNIDDFSTANKKVSPMTVTTEKNSMLKRTVKPTGQSVSPSKCKKETAKETKKRNSQDTESFNKKRIELLKLDDDEDDKLDLLRQQKK
mmetsp:Transcript_34214/g.39519  ORF Transcript_34214/g.39519 Transcript_34214/m.39519 type:complete len:89 (+) Transcript_34214:284-550(+)